MKPPGDAEVPAQAIDFDALCAYCFATASLVSGGMKMSLLLQPAPSWRQAGESYPSPRSRSSSRPVAGS